MANPAPTINQINAFNATQGTTIDFNIIGGTELIRSNRIYIYDLSDNSLICTHLYVSTESIHELPPNTDGSIVYESGKSSADFVNGAQYYAQIQTYTDTAGTQGGSGLSVAKMFWCLGDPTLTITTIPSTISTTSYNISAIYTDTSASVVSNIIQQYQFNLYSATGSLLQSSGVVVGSGTQQGTSAVYDISYNFTGLNVGSSYYVTVDVTTTQGMSVNAQSGTFTVSIDTPTLGEATVVNNACDGYISVTSNLSGEYGGSGSGEIVSFETDSENAFSKLQVDLEPTQEGSGTPSPSNVRPIRGHGGVDVNVVGKNLFDNRDVTVYSAYLKDNGSTEPPQWFYSDDSKTIRIPCKPNTTYTASLPIESTIFRAGSTPSDLAPIKWGDKVSLTQRIDAPNSKFIVCTTGESDKYLIIQIGFSMMDIFISEGQIEEGSTATPYEPYQQPQTITATLPQTVFGGYVDLISGTLVVTYKGVNLGDLTWESRESTGGTGLFIGRMPTDYKWASSVQAICSSYEYKGYIESTATALATLGNGGCGLYWNNTVEEYNYPFLYICNEAFAGNTGEQVKSAMNGVQLVYELATPQTYQLTPQQVNTLVGTNNVWSEQGNIELSYHIPITNLLVKRQDVDDVSGGWLTLYSQPITQASDMDFTFIDFLNQYGKTYKYALVPLLTQTQSGVEVEVEGGYTVSDEVQSVFDGVFIADSTGSQKCKANVGYGNVDMNQVVGSITPIGAKYPIIITNSHNQYHNGSISGTIVPDDYYFNGNLSRIDMVKKRNELEQFLTNKRVKVIKDWNGNIWLVMIVGNVSCTFNNNYGMGIVSFSTNWTEVGDPTNQQDLQATGLINVGGV